MFLVFAIDVDNTGFVFGLIKPMVKALLIQSGNDIISNRLKCIIF